MVFFDLFVLVLLFLTANVPSLLFLIWLRSGERGHVERLDDLVRTYVYGAVVAVLIATILELLATTYLLQSIEAETDLFTNNPNAVTFTIIIVLAPIIEEYAKAQGVVRISRFIWRPRNGLIFGAACGLGFAATENLLYEGTAFFSSGLTAFISIALIRIFSSALMHGSATAISGYGIARAKIYAGSWLPYFGLAVLIHASFNMLASLGVFFASRFGPMANVLGLIFASLLALISILYLRYRLSGFNA